MDRYGFFIIYLMLLRGIVCARMLVLVSVIMLCIFFLYNFSYKVIYEAEKVVDFLGFKWCMYVSVNVYDCEGLD